MSKLKFVSGDFYSDRDGRSYVYIGTVNTILFFLDDKNLTTRRYDNGQQLPVLISDGDIVKRIKPKQSRARYVNIYPNDIEEVFPTKLAADTAKKPNLIATVEQTIVFTDGDGLNG